jgi:hypothetical protein
MRSEWFKRMKVWAEQVSPEYGTTTLAEKSAVWAGEGGRGEGAKPVPAHLCISA